MPLMLEIPVPQLIISSISREGYAQMRSMVLMVSMISMKWPKEGRLLDISFIDLWKFAGSTMPRQISQGEADSNSGVGLTPDISERNIYQAFRSEIFFY
jgi:hypothetical protein